ncbi:hypothetical protein K504DRAFT_495952 [Pleomassaria siparia CBS 279.74]|uniref:Uncharacterized protein n=1 Tax=Pleomassaria siparia CBS 279.74 TaxID=1314801 RepID=A0A6G1JRG4_9PLEO|nr:hypothetical protein K504DRAFT_495952 [Pleomassaria siparia CBS 279.74]
MTTSRCTREGLKQYNIFYYEDVHVDKQDNDGPFRFRSYTLPDHVDAVRETLLTFENLIPKARGLDLDREFKEQKLDDFGANWSLQPPPSALLRDEAYHLSNIHEARKNLDEIKAHEQVAKDAHRLPADSGSEWQLFWKGKIFRNFHEDICASSTYSVVLDAISLDEDVTWNEFPPWQTLHQFPKGRSQPNPDLTYGFRIRKESLECSRGLEREDFTQGFSLSILGQLRGKGLVSAPTTGLHRWYNAPGGTALLNEDFSCFPWAIVEIDKESKLDKVSAESCYCKAASTAAAALTLQSNMIENSLGTPYPQIPPVIVFTCVGPVVKVWLAYQSWTKSGDFIQEMVCIWASSIQLTWGVVALSALVANMYMWASRILKPKVFSWIFEAWRNFTWTGSFPEGKFRQGTLSSMSRSESRSERYPGARFKPRSPTGSNRHDADRITVPGLVQEKDQVDAWRKDKRESKPEIQTTRFDRASQDITIFSRPKSGTKLLPHIPFNFGIQQTMTKGLPTSEVTLSHFLSHRASQTLGSEQPLSRTSATRRLPNKLFHGGERSKSLDQSRQPPSRLGFFPFPEDLPTTFSPALDATSIVGPIKRASHLSPRHGKSLTSPNTLAGHESPQAGEASNDADIYEIAKRLESSNIAEQSVSEVKTLESIQIPVQPNHESSSQVDRDSGSDWESISGSEWESEQDSDTPKRPVIVTDSDLLAWRKASLQALTGKQIGEMPMVATAFNRLSFDQRISTIYRVLDPPNDTPNSWRLRYSDAIDVLLSHLYDIADGYDRFNRIVPYADKDPRSHVGHSPNSISQARHVDEHLYLCFKVAFAAWPEYPSMDVLADAFATLTEEEREKLEMDAFFKVNEEDQNSSLMR